MGIRYCPICEPRPRRVYTHFMLYRESWHASFALLSDQKPLRRKLTFASEEKLYERARRSAAEEVLADLKRCIEAWGHGTVKRELTEAQLRALRSMHRFVCNSFISRTWLLHFPNRQPSSPAHNKFLVARAPIDARECCKPAWNRKATQPHRSSTEPRSMKCEQAW